MFSYKIKCTNNVPKTNVKLKKNSNVILEYRKRKQIYVLQIKITYNYVLKKIIIFTDKKKINWIIISIKLIIWLNNTTNFVRSITAKYTENTSNLIINYSS